MSEEGTAELHEIASKLVADAMVKNNDMVVSIVLCGSPNCRGHFGNGDLSIRHLPGDIPDGSIAKLTTFAESLGYTVKHDWWTINPTVLGETITMNASQADGDEVRDIHIKPRMSPAADLWTLAHEVAHVLAGDSLNDVPGNWQELSDEKKALAYDGLASAHRTSETRAGLTGYIVMEVLGIPVTDASVQLAGHAELGAREILPAVQPEAITHARKILAVIQSEDPRWQQ